MARIEIQAEPRAVLGKKVKALRRQGTIPANLYGPGQPPTPLQVEALALQRALAQVQGPTEVWLKISDQSPIRVAIHEVQRSPRYGGLVHLDFLRPAQA